MLGLVWSRTTTEPPDRNEEDEELGRMVDGLLCVGLLRTEPSPDISVLIDGVLGWKYPPPFGVLTTDDAVCTVCGEPGLGFSSNEKLERRSTMGVVYGKPVREES